MGFLDTLLGRTKPVQPKLDDLFALPSAAVTLDAGAGFKPTGSGSVCFRPVEGRSFSDVQKDVQDLLNSSSHAEGGLPVSAVSAAVIIADKSDVHRSRVRNPKTTAFDIHDRVNYAATASEIKVSRKEKLITLELSVDTEVAPIMEYFEIFLPRMMLSRRAAEFLHCNFALVINTTRLL